MKFIVSGVLVVGLAVLAFFLIQPAEEVTDPSVTQTSDNQGAEPDVEEAVLESIPAAVVETKLDRMRASFDQLVEMRKEMRLRLGRLSSRLRRSEFSPEKANEIAKQMRQANQKLKNPKLLGAFSNVKEINDEIASLERINVRLDAIKQLLDDKRAAQAAEETQ